jgi:hypothetical protein
MDIEFEHMYWTLNHWLQWTPHLGKKFKPINKGCGYVEHERCFVNLNFIKSKSYNQLTTHLTLVVIMFVQQFYMLENFPYLEVVVSWKDMQTQYYFNV